MRVPVRIKDDDSIGRLEIQTQTSSTRTEYEQEIVGLRVVKRI